MKRLILGVLLILFTWTLIGCAITTSTAETTTTASTLEETSTVTEVARDNNSLIEELADLIKGIFED